MLRKRRSSSSSSFSLSAVWNTRPDLSVYYSRRCAPNESTVSSLIPSLIIVLVYIENFRKYSKSTTENVFDFACPPPIGKNEFSAQLLLLQNRKPKSFDKTKQSTKLFHPLLHSCYNSQKTFSLSFLYWTHTQRKRYKVCNKSLGIYSRGSSGWSRVELKFLSLALVSPVYLATSLL